MALPLIFKTNKTMAIKKTTSVKKIDPPKKKYSPDSMIAGKTFGKVLKPGQKSDSYTYMENTRGGGQGGIRNKKDMPSLDPKKTIGKLEKEIEFQRSLLYGSKNPITAKSIEKRSANLYGAAKKKK